MREPAKQIQGKSFYEFDGFRVDPVNRLLFRDDQIIALTAKVFDILLVFVENSGRLLEKEEVMQKVWAGSFVEEGNLTRNVSTLRKVLGEDPKAHQYIVTVPGRGYKFVADVRKVEGSQGLAIVQELTVSKTIIEEETVLPDDEPGAQALPETAVRNKPALVPTKQNRLIILAAAGLLVMALLAVLMLGKASAPSPNTKPVKSIAVLPLKPVNIENRDPAYECGIADSLILKLSSVKEIIVRPLSATRKYTSLDQDPLFAGRELQVDYVLAPNYQLADGTLRLTAQLYNVETGTVETVFKCDEKCTNIFATEDAISEKVGRLLLTHLTREQNNLLAKRYTTNEEAYRLFIVGNYLSYTDEEKAVGYLEQAIKLDPNYALAYVRLAYAHRSIALFTRNLAEFAKAKELLAKALELDDRISEVWTVLGDQRVLYEWDFAGSEQAHKRALELNPNSAEAHCYYGLYLMSFARFDEALAEGKQALELDPTSVFISNGLAQILYHARRYDEAIAQCQRTLAMDADELSPYGLLWSAYEMKREYGQAIESHLEFMKRVGIANEVLQIFRTAYAKSGWKGFLQQQVAWQAQVEAGVVKRPRLNHFDLAMVYAQLGDRERAFEQLHKAYENHAWRMVHLLVEPLFDPLRSDPRFDELVRRVGLK